MGELQASKVEPHLLEIKNWDTSCEITGYRTMLSHLTLFSIDIHTRREITYV